MLDGGEGRRDAAPPDGGPPEGDCLADGECDDGVGCTEDVCYSSCGDPRECGGFCTNRPDLSRCAVGESCDRVRGCVPSRACELDRDCDDEDACTQDEYCDDSSRVCMWEVLDGDFDDDPPPVCGGTDCDDDDYEVFGGAPELCDGVDNDCDMDVDEGPEPAEDCGAMAVCRDGDCGCPDPSLELCFDGCVDLQTDDDNCGRCGAECPAEAPCVLGECDCPGALVYCGFDGCVDTQTDLFNCGECRRFCSGGECIAGACVVCGGLGEACCTTGTACDEGVCASGRCAACGRIGQPCCGGSTCTTGACAAGSCVACGGVDQPCCAGGACTATDAECTGGVCTVPECRLPLPPPPASIYPRCAASTLDCLIDCDAMPTPGCHDGCYAADPTPPALGYDCLACVVETIYACLSADTCRTEWGDWNCCVEARCPMPTRACVVAMCGPEDDALTACAAAAPDDCFIEAGRCFP